MNTFYSHWTAAVHQNFRKYPYKDKRNRINTIIFIVFINTIIKSIHVDKTRINREHRKNTGNTQPSTNNRETLTQRHADKDRHAGQENRDT